MTGHSRTLPDREPDIGHLETFTIYDHGVKIMDIQEFVFFGTKKQADQYKRRPKGTKTMREQPKGFMGNTMAKPRPEWTEDKGK